MWDSLAAWATRACDVDDWYAGLLESASVEPAALDPHVRGKIVHVFSIGEGARRISIVDTPLQASWRLTLDPRRRFDKLGSIDINESLSLDFDTQPIEEDDDLRERKMPERLWSVFAPTRFDQEDGQEAGFCGDRASLT